MVRGAATSIDASRLELLKGSLKRKIRRQGRSLSWRRTGDRVTVGGLEREIGNIYLPEKNVQVIYVLQDHLAPQLPGIFKRVLRPTGRSVEDSDHPRTTVDHPFVPPLKA